MHIKKTLLILLLIIFNFNQNDVLANTCSNAVSVPVKACECVPGGPLGLHQLCNCWIYQYNTNCSFLFGGAYCGYVKPPDDACMENYRGYECYDYDVQNNIQWDMINTGCSLCVTVNGNCNDEDYLGGVCYDWQIANKCDAGSAGTITTNPTTFTYKCYGNSCSDSVDDSCSVKRISAQSGTPGDCKDIGSVCSLPSATVANLCDTGSSVSVTDSTGTDGYFNWTCAGTTAGEVCGGGAGASAYCNAARISLVTRVDGVCSAINGTVVQTKPSSPPSTALCSVGTPSAVTTSGSTYNWTCYGTDGVCPTSTAIDRPCSATQDTAPNLSTTVLKSQTGSVVVAEVGGRNHSCDTIFGSSKTNVWTITATDVQGVADIGLVTLSFRSTGATYNTNPIDSVGGVANISVDTTSFSTGIYDVWVKIDDEHLPLSSGWLDTGRNFRVWDCQVEIDGELYDSSAEASFTCDPGNNAGFTTLIPTGLSFPFGYGNTLNENVINMTLASPYFTARKINNNTLTWQNTYFLSNNTTANYPGVLKASKIGGTCVSPSVQFSLSSYVDPYSDLPKANIKYTAVLDQEAWYRVQSGSVLANIRATNYVPMTCVDDDCKTSVHGLVWSNNVDLSDYDESREIVGQPPRFVYSYESLKNDIYGGLNIGTTIVGSVNWSSIGSMRGVIFVSGNLTIDQNISLGTSDYVFFIVKGKIIISENVTLVDGMFYTDSTIEAMGENNTQLKISGSLYGKGGITLSRSFANKGLNNASPAVEVTFNPNLIFKLPKEISESYENWTIE